MSSCLRIVYCNGCRWLPRACWMAQEFLTTFDNTLSEVRLKSGRSGEFCIWLDDICLWDRKADGGFPELAHIKQRIRDIVAPGQTLGHSDKKTQLDDTPPL